MSRDHFRRSISRDTNVEVSALSPDLQSALSKSKSPGDRKNIRITKSSNYRDSKYRSSLSGEGVLC